MYTDIVVCSETSTKLVLALLDAGILIGSEIGFTGAVGILYSTIGPRDDGLYYALIGIDDAVVSNVEEIKTRLEALTDPSNPPLRVRSGAEVPEGCPSSVTMRQARLALLQVGKLAAVSAVIAALPEPSKSAALIEWEYSNAVQRKNGFVEMIAPHIGMSEGDLDDLFTLAATL